VRIWKDDYLIGTLKKSNNGNDGEKTTRKKPLHNLTKTSRPYFKVVKEVYDITIFQHQINATTNRESSSRCNITTGIDYDDENKVPVYNDACTYTYTYKLAK